MVMELFVQLLNQTPLPTEQTLWARFSVCFSGLTVESAMIFKKKKTTENTQTPKKPTTKKPAHIIHTTGYYTGFQQGKLVLGCAIKKCPLKYMISS